MKKLFSAMRYAGVNLATFRKLDKPNRAMLMAMVAMSQLN